MNALGGREQVKNMVRQLSLRRRKVLRRTPCGLRARTFERPAA
jgi:hypothetical protein